ncbi:MAG: ComF family protein [Planctomycetes bacterium]|nr:ComF family protein [Planctomycetota bacterium]
MKFIEKYVSGLVSILYPKHCVICGQYLEHLEHSDFDLCRECWEALPTIGSSFCAKCGAYLGPYTKPAKNCSRCKGELANIEKVVALFRYKDSAKDLIHKLKFDRQRHVAYSLANMLASHLTTDELISKIDYIIPVPLHWKREMHRTFNQSEIICSTLAKKLKLKYRTNIIVRKKATREQSKLTRLERKKNLKDAFALSYAKKHKIRNSTIMLIDDVMTTGTTLSECAQVLKKGGAKKVYGAVVCRA